MAGTYPDVPGYRFAYDQDGTNITIYDNDQVGTTVSEAKAKEMNSDNASASGQVVSSNGLLVFLFPETRHVTGVFLRRASSVPSLQCSTDTSNGIDGSWQTISGITTISNGVKPDGRNNINIVNLTNIKAIRASGTGQVRNLHFYGSISTSESLDRLRIVDMSGDDIAAQLDFGDIRQRNNVTRQFKVVNNSDTKTANNITITFDAPTDASPSLIGQYQLSTDNTAYANAINIGNLAPGASSGTLYVRNTVAANAQLSVWSLRLIASANTWS